jgi:hypothetical protein
MKVATHVYRVPRFSPPCALTARARTQSTVLNPPRADVGVTHGMLPQCAASVSIDQWHLLVVVVASAANLNLYIRQTQ